MTITIKTVDSLKLMNPRNPRAIDAEEFGNLAVHPSIGYLPLTIIGLKVEPYSVTHIPTGMCIERCLTKAQAMELVARLQPLNWDFTDPKEAAPLSEAVAKAVSAVRLGVK